jgi:hypothetical protein
MVPVSEIEVRILKFIIAVSLGNTPIDQLNRLILKPNVHALRSLIKTTKRLYPTNLIEPQINYP